MSMIVNRRDLDFMLYETLDMHELLKSPRYSDYDRSAIDAVFDLAQSIAEDKFLSCASKGDAEEPAFVDGAAVLIPEIKHAVDAFREAGLSTTAYDTDIGGMQVPTMVDQALKGMFACANTAVFNYLFLSQGVANMLNACGSEALKTRYLPNLVAGHWLGTMCLSETQAGSSLADIRTKAEPLADGSYKLTGTKMWISCGDHQISDNIIHMVLAKIPGGPPGVKGISLFLVPKNRLTEEGEIGEDNNIVLAGLNHKMGQRATINCLLNFGEGGDSIGYLVGDENRGLANMFNMMNEARLSVGMAAVMCGLGGYLYSLDYARNRPQGRRLVDRDPTSPMVMISQHADVKRMLMTQKAFVEGAQMLVYYCARLIDQQKLAADKEQQQRIELLLDLLTPIAKSWPSEFCLEANKLAIQVLGGYGYTRDYPVERLYRDNRLNHIHEGTLGIQAIDLLGRKVRIKDGMALKLLRQEMQATLAEASAIPELASYAEQLEATLAEVECTVKAVNMADNAELGLANATLFLHATGHVVIAWMWLMQALAALRGRSDGAAADADFYSGKLAAVAFFYGYELPKAFADLRLVAALDTTCYDLTDEQFIGV